MIQLDDLKKDDWIIIYEHLDGDGHLSDDGRQWLEDNK